MADIANRLIARLPRQDRAAVFAAGEFVSLPTELVLAEPGRATGHAYFPADGAISVRTAAVLAHADGLELGLVGCEGMLGAQLVLGLTAAPLRAVVQQAGSAHCIRADRLRHLLSISAALRQVLFAYVQVLMSQQATAVACMAFHRVEQRLARRLLMAQDRSCADGFHLTHDMLGRALGVRRVGITGAARALQRRGLIRYRRGDITIVDRPGLEALACSCYAADHQIYVSVMTASAPVPSPAAGR